MSSIRILLAEDHTLMRAGVRALVERLEGMEVIGEASTGVEALSSAEALRPDLVLLDLSLPDLSGIEVASRMSKSNPGVRILMLSMHRDPMYVRRALSAGACGYLVKGADVPELEIAIRAAMRGESYLSPAVSNDLLDDYRSGRESTSSPFDALTTRQREICVLVVQGRGTKDIASLLDLSVKTVEFHRAKAMARLSVQDVPKLVRLAIRHGLIAAES